MSTRITKTWFDNGTLLTQEIPIDGIYKCSPEATHREDKSMTGQLKLAEGMAEEIKQVIYKYSEAMPLATAIGCLEIVKYELMRDHEGDEDETD